MHENSPFALEERGKAGPGVEPALFVHLVLRELRSDRRRLSLARKYSSIKHRFVPARNQLDLIPSFPLSIKLHSLLGRLGSPRYARRLATQISTVHRKYLQISESITHSSQGTLSLRNTFSRVGTRHQMPCLIGSEVRPNRVWSVVLTSQSATPLLQMLPSTGINATHHNHTMLPRNSKDKTD
jgi:hypothetical protein